MRGLIRVTFKFTLALLLGVCFGLFTSTSASPITFGKEVLNAKFEYPTVLPIWYKQGPYSEFQHICTGTLIEPRIVLTAAHCVLPTGLIQVGYGGNTIDSGQRQSVSAVWKHPGFSEKFLVNDIGLLLLEKPITSITPTPLISASALSKMVKQKDSLFEVVGWGKDQNGENAFYLRKAVVVDESLFLQKKAKWWRNDVWIAAGKFNKKEKVYAGACNGDSGGPLFVSRYGNVAIAGVVSFGIAEECETYLPSVFARMSYYTKLIIEDGIPTLLLNESTRNRSLPSVITEPRITGTARAGQTLTCDKGTWSANTSQISVDWSGLGVPYGTTSSAITLSDNTSGSARTFTCTVTGSNANGSTSRVLTVVQPTKPVVRTSPVISGFPTVASTSSVTASCLPGTFSGSTSVSEEWWIGDYFTPSTRISTGNSLVVSSSLFTQYGGKYLYCLSSASGEGGSASATSRGVPVPTFEKPVVQTFPTINGFREWQSPAINTVATCSGWAWKGTVTQETIEWYANTSYALSGATKVGTGMSLTLSENFLNMHKSKYIMCAVSGTNLGGTQIMYAGLYLYYSRSDSTTPTPTPTPTSGTTIAKPNVPENFGGVIGATFVSLSWVAPANNGVAIIDYVIERSSISSTSGWVVISDGTSTQVAYTDTGLTPGVRYYYRIRAFNGTLYSEYSSTISASIPLASTPTPTPKPTPTPTATLSAARQEIRNGNQNTTTGLVPVPITGICKLNGSVSTSPIFPKQKPNDDFWVYFGISNVSVDQNASVNFNSITWLRNGMGFPDNITLTPEIWAQLNGKYLVVRTVHSFVRFLGFEPEGYGSILCRD